MVRSKMKNFNIRHLIALAVLVVAATVGQASAQSDPPALRYFRQGIMYVQTNNLELAAIAFRASVRSDPQFADAWLMLSGTLLDLGYWEDAEKCLLQAIELKPELGTRLDVKQMLAILGIRQPGEEGSAGSSPRGSRDVGTDAISYINLGMVFASRGEIEQATRAFLAAVWTDSSNAEAWIWLGLGLYDLGHQQLSYRCLKRGLAIKPELGEDKLIKSVLAEISENYAELTVQ
jgi:tetratricopeptide (TPR) repeat protein